MYLNLGKTTKEQVMNDFRIDRDYGKMYEWDIDASCYLFCCSIIDDSMTDVQLIVDYLGEDACYEL